MLIRLLRQHLAPYRNLLMLLVVLQTIQASFTLILPNLNADVINKGVMTGDTSYIWHMGGWMLLATALQLGFAVSAVFLGSRVAMMFGRDVRSSLFHRVTDFSAQEVNSFGAPSLITRITNDVQQVQMLVVMTCTLALAAPITAIGGVIMATRQDLGLSWILLVSMPVLLISIGAIVVRMVPQFRDHGRTASTPSTGCCESRSRASAWCGPSCVSRRRRSGSRRSTPSSPRPRCGPDGSWPGCSPSSCSSSTGRAWR